MKARTAPRTSSALRKIRPHTTCSLRVRMNRSATPLVSGWRTKAKLGVRPRKAIWVWKGSDIKALPWSWRSRRPRAASARTAVGVDGEIESLGGGEAVGLFGDVPAEHLGVPVLDDHEEGDVAVLNGWDHRRVRAPHDTGRVGGDASVVVVGRPLRAAVRREQSILAHERPPQRRRPAWAITVVVSAELVPCLDRLRFLVAGQEGTEKRAAGGCQPAWIAGRPTPARPIEACRSHPQAPGFGRPS